MEGFLAKLSCLAVSHPLGTVLRNMVQGFLVVFNITITHIQ
jgi:hypothetical protein